MKDLSPRLENLFDKMETLMVKYAKVRDENRRLQEEVRELTRHKEERDEQIRDLDHKVAVLKTVKTLPEDEDHKGEIRSKVNEYIREIDKCIAMLNA